LAYYKELSAGVKGPNGIQADIKRLKVQSMLAKIREQQQEHPIDNNLIKHKSGVILAIKEMYLSF